MVNEQNPPKPFMGSFRKVRRKARNPFLPELECEDAMFKSAGLKHFPPFGRTRNSIMAN